MIKTILKCLVAAVIYALLFFLIVNIGYYRFNMNQTMFHNFHYYAWVQYVEGTGMMFVASLIFEIIRSLLRKK